MAEHQTWANDTKGQALSNKLIQLNHSKSDGLLTGLQEAASKLAADQAVPCMYQEQSLTQQIYQELTEPGSQTELAFIAPSTFTPFSSKRPGPKGGTIWVQGSNFASKQIIQATASSSPHVWEVQGRWLIIKQSGRSFDLQDSKDQSLKFLMGKKADCYSLVFQPTNQADAPPPSIIANQTVCISSSVEPTKYIRVESKGVSVRENENFYFCKDLCIWHVAPSKNKAGATRQGSGPISSTPTNIAATPRLPVLPAQPQAVSRGKFSLQSIGLRAASMIATTNQVRDRVLTCFALGQVDELVLLLQNSRQFVGKLSDIKDAYQRNLLSLLCTEVRRWPPGREENVEPAPWEVKLELYYILQDFNDPAATTGVNIPRPYTRCAQPLPETLLSLYSSENNKKARPLHQLMYFAKDCVATQQPSNTAEFGPIQFLQKCLDDIQLLSPEDRLEHVLLAMSQQAFRPHHNAVKEHNEMALKMIIERIIDTMIEIDLLPKPSLSPRQSTNPPRTKRLRSTSPYNDDMMSTLQECFQHPASKYYKNGELVEATLASVLCSRYGGFMTADDLKLPTASKAMQSDAMAVPSTVINPSQQAGTSIASQTVAKVTVAGPLQQVVSNVMPEAGRATMVIPPPLATQLPAGLISQPQPQPQLPQVQHFPYTQQPIQLHNMPSAYVPANVGVPRPLVQMHRQQPPTGHPDIEQWSTGHSLLYGLQQDFSHQQYQQQWQAPASMPHPQHVMPLQPLNLGAGIPPSTTQQMLMQPQSTYWGQPPQAFTQTAMSQQPHTETTQMEPVGQHKDMSALAPIESPQLPSISFGTFNLVQQPVFSVLNSSLWNMFGEGPGSNDRPITPQSHLVEALQEPHPFEASELTIPTAATTVTTAAAATSPVMGNNTAGLSLDQLMNQVSEAMPENNASTNRSRD